MLVTRCVDDVSKVGSIVKDAEEVRALVETAGGFERADGDAEGAPLDMIPREAAFYGGSDGGGGDDDGNNSADNKDSSSKQLPTFEEVAKAAGLSPGAARAAFAADGEPPPYSFVTLDRA